MASSTKIALISLKALTSGFRFRAVLKPSLYLTNPALELRSPPTNRVSAGLFDMATLNSIHDKMLRELAQIGGRIDAIFYCPHAADERCQCRKPKPGMILEIGKRFSVELDKVPAVGDALRDLHAYAAAGCQPILVRTGKGEATLAAAAKSADNALPENTWICADLNEAVQRIIAAYIPA